MYVTQKINYENLSSNKPPTNSNLGVIPFKVKIIFNSFYL